MFALHQLHMWSSPSLETANIQLTPKTDSTFARIDQHKFYSIRTTVSSTYQYEAIQPNFTTFFLYPISLLLFNWCWCELRPTMGSLPSHPLIPLPHNTYKNGASDVREEAIYPPSNFLSFLLNNCTSYLSRTGPLWIKIRWINFGICEKNRILLECSRFAEDIFHKLVNIHMRCTNEF